MEAGRCDGGSLKWGQRGASARVGRVKREGSRTSLRCTAVVVVRLQGCGERRTAWKWATGASRSGSWKGFGRGSWRASVPPGSFTHSVAQGFLSQRRSPIPIAPELTLLPPRAGVNYSFSVSAKSSNFNRTKQTRTYMIGTDLNRSSTSSPLSPLPPPCALPPNAPPPPPPTHPHNRILGPRPRLGPLSPRRRQRRARRPARHRPRREDQAPHGRSARGGRSRPRAHHEDER